MNKGDQIIYLPNNIVVEFYSFFNYKQDLFLYFVYSKNKIFNLPPLFKINIYYASIHNIDSKYIGKFLYFEKIYFFKFPKNVNFKCSECKQFFTGYSSPFNKNSTICYGCKNLMDS